MYGVARIQVWLLGCGSLTAIHNGGFTARLCRDGAESGLSCLSEGKGGDSWGWKRGEMVGGLSVRLRERG